MGASCNQAIALAEASLKILAQDYGRDRRPTYWRGARETGRVARGETEWV